MSRSNARACVRRDSLDRIDAEKLRDVFNHPDVQDAAELALQKLRGQSTPSPADEPRQASKSLSLPPFLLDLARG